MFPYLEYECRMKKSPTPDKSFKKKKKKKKPSGRKKISAIESKIFKELQISTKPALRGKSR